MNVLTLSHLPYLIMDFTPSWCRLGRQAFHDGLRNCPLHVCGDLSSLSDLSTENLFLFVCLSVCLSVCLCLSLCLSVCLSLCDATMILLIDSLLRFDVYFFDGGRGQS